MKHECVRILEIREVAGIEEADADAEYDNALKEAIRGVQDAMTAINEHLEEVRYEIAALKAEWLYQCKIFWQEINLKYKTSG